MASTFRLELETVRVSVNRRKLTYWPKEKLIFFYFTQLELHKIFQHAVSNKESRYQFMEYIARLLITNEKRVQYQVEERTVATDGLMLNLLSVLQLLSVKVRFSLHNEIEKNS